MSILCWSLALLALQPVQNVKSELLPPMPSDWHFERIDFPLPFAPELKYQGFEELRFSPGMFNTRSDTYFTYVFAMKIEDKIVVDSAFLDTLLTTYFRGLCRTVAEGSGFHIDPAKITATVKEDHYEAPSSRHFHASIESYDPFVTGRPITLHLDILTVDVGPQDHRIFAGVSPRPKDDPIWKVLHDIERKIQKRVSKAMKP